MAGVVNAAIVSIPNASRLASVTCKSRAVTVCHTLTLPWQLRPLSHGYDH
jgi:hypothetical protein